MLGGLLRAHPAPASQVLPTWAWISPGASERTPPLSFCPQTQRRKRQPLLETEEQTSLQFPGVGGPEGLS